MTAEEFHALVIAGQWEREARKGADDTVNFPVRFRGEGMEVTAYHYIQDGPSQLCSYCGAEDGPAQGIVITKMIANYVDVKRDGPVWKAAMKVLAKFLPFGKAICYVGSPCDCKGFQREFFKGKEKLNNL